MTRRIMVQGTMSGVGKSLLTTALCRIFAQDGLRVVPFKSQNMALNSYVTRDGREMGRAQAMQAQAAGVEPDVRMNPILLKPSSDVGSQLVVMGRARGDYRAADYFKMKRTLVPEVLTAYEGLATEADVVVIEGAGSPAEINLKAGDIVNMGLARMVDAPVLLVGDIDRGGVFAQLFGTVALLEPEERARVAGLVVNKFRGDVDILRPGLAMLEERCGAPVLGVVPYVRVDVDDEDSLAPRLATGMPAGCGRRGDGRLDVAVLRLPRISNFTDFAPLERHPGVSLRYVGRVGDLGEPDLVIVPGTKSTMDDLVWLREGGLEAAVRRLALTGVSAVLGVCGGYQMLGERLDDPDGVERAGGGSLAGMGLLPCTTVFASEKVLTRVRAHGAAPGWEGVRVEGYEIHAGRTDTRRARPLFQVDEVEGAPGGDGRGTPVPEGAVSAGGNVLGTYLHGLFDTGALADALVAWLRERRANRGGGRPIGVCGPGTQAGRGLAGGVGPATGSGPGDEEAFVPSESHDAYQARQFDILADAVRCALDMDAVYRVMDEYAAHGAEKGVRV